MSNEKGVMIQSVARVIEILDCFLKDQELGISEIAEKVQLSKSTVYGLVNTLAHYGYLEQGENHKYHLGLKLFELGTAAQSRLEIGQEAMPICQTLADKYHTTVHLAAFTNGEAIYIGKVEDPTSLVSYSRVGKIAPMYCTGVGKAILANLPEDSISEWIERNSPLESRTKNTITTKEELLNELRQIKSFGYALDNEEIEPGIACVAAPIFNYNDEPIGAISISFFVSRALQVDENEVIGDVRESAKKISQRMGWMI